MSSDNKLKGKEGVDYAHRDPIALEMIPKGRVLMIGERNDRPLSDFLRKDREVKTLDLENCDYVCDLEKGLPKDMGKFDCVYAGEVIEHIRNLKPLLKEIRDILNPNGVFVFTTPNLVALPERIKFLFGMLPINSALGDYFENGHVRVWNWKMIQRYMDDAGFEIIEKKTDGITFRGKMISKISPLTWGSAIIVKAKVKNNGS